jgi:hypothetical protein
VRKVMLNGQWTPGEAYQLGRRRPPATQP